MFNGLGVGWRPSGANCLLVQLEAKAIISAATHDWFPQGLTTHLLLSVPIYQEDQWLWCSGLPENFLEALTWLVSACLS